MVAVGFTLTRLSKDLFRQIREDSSQSHMVMAVRSDLSVLLISVRARHKL